jgi:hypothetical protein
MATDLVRGHDTRLGCSEYEAQKLARESIFVGREQVKAQPVPLV